MRREALPFGRRAAGIGVVLVPVVRRKLCRTQSQPIQITQDSQIAVQIVAAFDIEHRGHLSLGMDALHIVCVQRQPDLVAVHLQLAQRVIDPAERLFGLEPAGVVLFGNEHGEEERAFSTFPRTRQIPLSVGLACAHTATVIELAVQRVDMPVKDQRPLMHVPCARRDLWRRLIGGALKGSAAPKRGAQHSGRHCGVAQESAAAQHSLLQHGT
jgi:hypothetical protein